MGNTFRYIRKVNDYVVSLLKSETKFFIISEEDLIEEFEVEEVFPISNLHETDIEIPEGSKYFTLLPVDYNRGTDDIVITFFTEIGKELFSDKVTGDY